MPMTISMVTPGGDNSFFYQMPNFSILIFSILLWVFTNPIATFISRGFKMSDESTNPMNNYSLEYVIISAVGLYMFITSLPGLLGVISFYFTMGDLSEVLSQKKMYANFYQKLVTNIAYGSLGIILIIFSKKITTLFRRFRMQSKEDVNI